MSPKPSPSASASPSPSPSATPSPSPSATPSPSPAPNAKPPVSYGVDIERLVTATSLAAALQARERLAAAELAALEEHLAARSVAHDAALAAIEAADVWSGRLEHARERLVAGAERERAALEDLLEAAGAKRAEIARLRARGQALADAATRSSLNAAEAAVLRQLDQDARAANDAIERLVAQAGVPATSAAAAAEWAWPVQGSVSQRFGATGLALEPPRVYGGVAFDHFHDAIDIAAPFGSAVVAAAPGRVSFVGHLPDGAMIVLIAHDGGLVSLYAHLDDAFAPPTVRAGADVSAGQVVGYVGLTGITTGPHLHFSVRRAGEPLDPLTLLPAR